MGSVTILAVYENHKPELEFFENYEKMNAKADS